MGTYKKKTFVGDDVAFATDLGAVDAMALVETGFGQIYAHRY